MPNRILRDWTCSEKINELSDSAELFFIRLIMKADDFGRYYGTSKLLKAGLFPLKDYSLKNIESMKKECVDAGIIKVYTSDKKDFIEIIDFGQRLRVMKSKFPEPEELEEVDSNTRSIDSNMPLETNPKRNESEIEEETENEIFNFKKSLLNLGIEKQVVSDWLKVRGKKRAANTQTAFDAIYSEIMKSGKHPNECIEKAVSRSWAGFEASWMQEKQTGYKTAAQQMQDFDAAVDRGEI